MKYTTILFDLDGTLTKSEKGITRSALHAAARMGFTGHTEEQFRVFIGPPLYDSFMKVCGMTGEQAEQAIVYYRERFSTVGYAENEVYTGIASLLRSLKKNGCKVAIATAKPQVFAEKIAVQFGFMPYLDAIVGPDFSNKHASKAWIVKKAMELLGGTPVMIGDRCYDVEGGKENGIDTIGVTYGYGSREELESAGATHIADSVEELADILLEDAPRARGVFITMEGMDGCGKTTQRNALLEHLRVLGWDVQVTREPGGDEIAGAGGGKGRGLRPFCRFVHRLSGRRQKAGQQRGRCDQPSGRGRHAAGYHRVSADEPGEGALPQAQRLRA